MVIESLTLPYPPSVNHYWRCYRGRMIISREGRTYRDRVCALPFAPEAQTEDPEVTATSVKRSGNGPRKPPAGGRIALCMDAFPPDRRRRDLDNLQKAVLDSLEHAGIYQNDSQIDLLITRRCTVTRGGRIDIVLFEFPLRRCPLCGAATTLISPENN